jgi:hypothetical protein
MSEKRRSERKRIAYPVIVQFDNTDNEAWLAYAKDSSGEGILLWSARALPVNVPLIVRFPREWGKTFAIARVVRSDGCLYGCEFIHQPQKLATAFTPPALAYRARLEDEAMLPPPAL